MNRPLNPWKVTGYKAGQLVSCKVVASEPGGYSVVIVKDNLPGFLPIEARLKIGEEVLAQFVCVHNNRVLLSARMAGSANSAPTAQPQTDWRKELEGGLGKGGAPAQAEGDLAFEVWAHDRPVNFRLRRAIDLILPPIDPNIKPQEKIITGSEDLMWLITDLEGGMRTGCVKAYCEGRKSRSAVLLYKGRAVGCIYGNKELKEPLPTENSLQMMLTDCQTPETQLVMYGLPEDVSLSMSALFLGYPVERSDDLDARAYMDYIMDWFVQKEQTACLAFTLPASGGTLLAFIHRGQFSGAFYVENQEFSRDISFVHNLIAQDANAGVEASILPPELTSSSVRFGYSLSMAMPRS
ncbi:MAG: hypothetical protein K2W82_19645 [Candidatus Obscuribacterales bacterium]|nr:hypothetical protein [Candidatus Obscuribacterales bacterium]